MQMREDGTGLNQGGRKWLYSDYSLKGKPEGFMDGSSHICERMRGIRDNSMVLDLSNWWNR